VSKHIRYSDHLDTLIALTTYLALVKERSRSPFGLTRDLGLEESEVTRYARCRSQPPANGESEELAPEQLQSLPGFVSEQARLESETCHHRSVQI
jgi:hypothetical protein